MDSETELGYLARYDAMADRAAQQVISAYSTSFSLATQLLGSAVRRDISNLYAMVRIADEIVDGTAEQANLADVEAALNSYEKQVRAAPSARFHTDPVLHAYAQTARRCGIEDDHVVGFFRSMRTDLHQTAYDATSLEKYIYGSAEVIGLMCLSIFLANSAESISPPLRSEMEDGARALGAAFQKINFLRDYAEDSRTLGRSYFPGSEYELTEKLKERIVAEIRSDLSRAWKAIPLLPVKARVGVVAATDFFTHLTVLAEGTPVEQLRTRRISVPSRTKARIFASAMVRAPRMKGNKP